MDKAKIILILAISLLFVGLITLPFTFAKTDSEKLDDLDLKIKYITDLVTVPNLEVYGTEYATGEIGKIWLQLLDENRNPIENSTCLIKVWFPNSTLFLNESGMSYLDEGIHYKDFTVPDVTGVYPQTAICSVPELIANYSMSNYTTIALDNLETGDGDGGLGWISGWGFDTTGYCGISSLNSPIGSYHIRCSGYNGKGFRTSFPPISGIANITFWARFSSLEAGEYYHFEVFNETLGDWDIIRTWDENEDDDIYKRYSFYIDGCRSGILLRFRSESLGGADYGYFDNITVSEPTILNYYEVNGTEYQYVFGSGEIHVSEALTNVNTNITNEFNDLLKYFIFKEARNLKSNHDYCSDNTTLVKILTYEESVLGDLYTYQRNETVFCDYGCFKYFNTAESQGYCAPSTISKWIPIIGIVLFVFIMLIIAFAVRL